MLPNFDKEFERIKKGNCPFCNEKIDKDEFKDPLSIKEFNISGLCQKCQDKFFD